MSVIDDGGPAFPVFPETGDAHAAAFRGQSLRDYFAAKAMQNFAIPAMYSLVNKDSNECDIVVARRSYELADAMLEAREQ